MTGPSPDPELMIKAREILSQARRVAVLTGAGVSAESGVPTFRGADGIWKKHDVTRLATPEAFTRDPELVWEFYNWRRELLSRCEPNPAHLALARLEERTAGLTLITQNVDGLHARAGSRNLIEIHGNLWRSKCTACSWRKLDRSPQVAFPPLCPECATLTRPAVVWFGEALDSGLLEAAARACRECEVMLVVGTSALVYPAASLAPLAAQAGARVIEVNLEPTPASEAMDISLLGRAGEILPRLVG